jgi:cyclopropane fatty-acyl-phospholipid synthase-like methyltransferase
VITIALRDALVRRGFTPGSMHAFDLTPAMIDRFQRTLAARSIDGVQITQADVLELETLPRDWTHYDLIVTASMLEYLPRDRIADALKGLRMRLHDDGKLILFITRRNWCMRAMIGRWWRATLYSADELQQVLREAGFSRFEFRRFPLAASYLNTWGLIAEADR